LRRSRRTGGTPLWPDVGDRRCSASPRKGALLLRRASITCPTRPRSRRWRCSIAKTFQTLVACSNCRARYCTRISAGRRFPTHEFATLARARNIPLIDLNAYGLRPEPTVQAALLAGADLVTMRHHRRPKGSYCADRALKRALRLDKVRLAMLGATLKLYRDPRQLPNTLPTLGTFSSCHRRHHSASRATGAAYAQRRRS
jgi:L-seryl-tRNA selenium transferase